MTRPSHQSHELVAALKNNQLTVWSVPLLEIEPLTLTSTFFENISKANQFIWLSPNAVLSVTKQCSKEQLKLFAGQHFAVGAKTAELLEQHGFAPVIKPQTANSEGLIELLDQAKTQSDHYLIIAGEKGRGLIEHTLNHWGVGFERATVYRQRAKRVFSSTEKQLVQNPSTIWLVTSELAMSSLYQSEHPGNVKMIVSSQRLKEKALELEFNVIGLSRSALTGDLIKTVNQLCEKNVR